MEEVKGGGELTQNSFLTPCVQSWYTHTHCTCTCTCTYTHVHMYIQCTCIDMYMCTYSYTRTNVHVHALIQCTCVWYTMDKVPETASNVLPSFTSPKSVSRMLAPYSNQTKIEKHSKISNTHHKHNPHNSPALQISSPPHTRSVLHSLPSMARADTQTMSCYGLPSKNTPSMWWYVQYCVAVKHAVVQSARLLYL